ncbi:sce7726 family protein [Lachnospiraceae bacterium KK002]
MLYDKDIREPLFDFLEEKYGKIRIIEEKSVGRSRADVVMVLPESLCGLEIKSDADTYARLSRQVRDYNQYFDYNYIVAGTKHAHHVEEHVPDWWGIITVELEEGRPDFYLLRKAGENPKVNWKRKMGLMWRPELARIQERNRLPKYREKSKDFVIDKILLKVPKERLYRQISDELFERDYTEIEENIRAYKKEALLRRLQKKGG